MKLPFGQFSFERFLEGQPPVLAAAERELRGEKIRSWMWLVFPRLARAGYGKMSERYGLECLAEARAFAKHPTLAPTLVKNAQLLLEWDETSFKQAFSLDDRLHVFASMTLFVHACEDPVFRDVLKRLYSDSEDVYTLEKIGLID